MKEEKVNKRIGNLQLRKATYLGKEPEHVSYHIGKWEPNGYYGNEDKFIDEGDYYRYPDGDYRFVRIHKSCFKHPETCCSVATFEWDDHEEIYELHFIVDRPLHLSKEEREIFWQPIELTEEFFKKNGFVRQHDWEDVMYYISEDMRIQVYENYLGWVVNIDNENFTMVFSSNLKYVHELQNAYYVSTGEEMEIKL